MGKAWFGHGPSSSFSKWFGVPSAGFRPPFRSCGGHERALAPLLVLLLTGTARGTFVGVLFPLCLALEAVKDRSNHLLARGVAGGDVEELHGGLLTLTFQLVNQGLTGGPKQEGSYDVDVSDIG